MTEAYVYDAIRTPRGRGKKTGSLHEVKPISLVTGLIEEMQKRNPSLDPAGIEDLVLGVVSPVGDQGSDIAKTAALAAGLPYTVAGVQLNRFCASGLEAVNQASQRVRSGWEDLILAGGVESMSRVPMASDGGAWAMDPKTAFDTDFVPQGIGADLIATIEGYSREDVDTFAAESQARAAKAIANGYFSKSVIPVKDANGLTILDHDEFVREGTTVESLSGLPPAFEGIGDFGGFDSVALEKYHHVEKINHVHHAGNSSGIVDGASLVLIGSEQAGQTHGLTPRARILATAVSGSEPTIMLTGPAPGEPQGARQGRHVGRGHRPHRDQRGVRRRRHEAHARPRRLPARPDQRQRRRDRHGPPARCHRRDDPRHADRRARASRQEVRPRHAVRRRRHGHRHRRRAPLTLSPICARGPAPREPDIEGSSVSTAAVRYEKADGIVNLVIDDPSQSSNTMNQAYRDSMENAVNQLVDEIAADGDSIKGVIVSSGKKTFFAGGDLKLMTQATPADAEEIFENIQSIKATLRKLETCGKPVVAAINGAALGGGLEIALACHHRIAADGGYEIGLPEVTLGLLPGGGGVTRTVRMFGLQDALMNVLLQGPRMKPTQAKETGLVDEVVATQDELLPRREGLDRVGPG